MTILTDPFDRARLRGDRGSLPLALLVVIVASALTAMLVPIMVTQAHTTRFDNRRATTLQAAESGLEVALGLMRAATKIDDTSKEIVGDVERLPCGEVSGSVDPASTSRYTVNFAYYTQDPTGHDAAWLAQSKMACVTGHVMHYDDDSDQGILVPSYVRITAAGSDGQAEQLRTLQAIYHIKTTNVPVEGGQLPLFPAPSETAGVTWCIDAGTATPVAGQTITFQKCVDKGTATKEQQDRQNWSYRANLTLRFTATAKDGNGLCITSQGDSKNVTLTACPEEKSDSSGNPILGAYQQIWGVNDSGHFALSNSSKNGLSGSCLGMPDPGGSNPKPKAGDLVKTVSCTGSTTDPFQAFNPQPSVGSGQAGPDDPTPGFLVDRQVVNFQQFSRCIDVTNQSVATGDNGGTFLILYPCKQNPSTGSVAWNQKFTQVAYAGGVQWKTRTSSTDYCLTSPLAVGVGKYVHVEQCSSSKTSSQVWTRYEGTDDATGQTLPSKQRYTLVDSTGLCLNAGPNEDMYNGNPKLVVSPCDGSGGQKWNVPPTEQNPGYANLHETVAEG